MQLFVVAIRDEALGCYTRLAAVGAIGGVIRAFGDMVTGADAEMSKHPSDYKLFHVGYMDDVIGKLTPLEAPERVARGRDYVKG